MPAELASILIVDDDRDTLELLPLLLRRDGSEYDICTCSNLSDAKRLINQKHFDIFILDYLLHHRTGAEFCSEIRSAAPKVPIIIYSALSTQDARRESMRAGANLYMVKPNDLDRLSIAVRELLNDRPLNIPDAPCGRARGQAGSLRSSAAHILAKRDSIAPR